MAAETVTPRRIPIRAVRLGLTTVGVVALALRLRTVAEGQEDRLVESATHQLWPVLVVLVLSFGLRSRSTAQVVAAALTGFFTAIWLAQMLGDVAIDRLGFDSPIRLSLVVPLIEEIAKLVPVVVAAIIWSRRRGSPGIVDLALLGMASGAGFAIHEDALWSRVASSGFGGPVGWLLPSAHDGDAFVAGHVVWTGVVGLAVGLWLTHRGRLAGLLAALASAMSVFDHGTANLDSFRADWHWLVLDGWLPVGVLVVGVAAAFVHDGLAVRRLPRPNRPTPRSVVQHTLRGKAGTPVRRAREGMRILRVAGLAAHARAESGAAS